MKRIYVKWFVCIMAGILTLSGCSKAGKEEKTKASEFTADNEIVSYKPIDTEKTIITVGKYSAFDESPLEEALESKFPDIELVWMETFVGPDPFAYMSLQSEHGSLPDISFTGRTAPENDFLYDLSAEDFVSRYNLSALNAMNIEGKLYQIPIGNTVTGIAYNKTLFEEHGWKAPESLEEFYALCDTISAEGIRPFAPCLKYYTTLESMALGLSFDDVLANIEKQTQYNEFVQKDASCRGLLEPMFSVMRTLYDKGIITGDDFSSSATEARHDLYEGKNAMIVTNLDILTLYNEEKPDCELDYIGFPTKTKGERWLHMIPGTRVSVSDKAMKDKEKKQMILDILDYISTDEGQKALFQSFSGISSLTSYQKEAHFDFDDIAACVENGRVFFADYYGSNEYISVFKDWTVGNMTMEEMIEANDNFEPLDELKQLKETPIGTASKDFTVLETSILNADVMRKATDAQIALVLNNYYYKGNLAEIFEGDIVYPARFILKSVSAKDYLTTYEITGKNLKELLEHPIINGTEINAMYAPSGLKIEYAPYAPADANVLKVTLTDGAKLSDDEVYTVAAWPGSIDEKYISHVVKEYSELGMNKDLMTAAIQSAGEIKPAGDGRVVLNWEKVVNQPDEQKKGIF